MQKQPHPSQLLSLRETAGSGNSARRRRGEAAGRPLSQGYGQTAFAARKRQVPARRSAVR